MDAETNINKLYKHWDKIFPPARPSADAVRYYSECLFPEAKVLILGCTPELRTACHEKNCDVVVSDRSKEIYDNVTPLVRVHRKEKFVQANWQDFDLEKNFDFIFGHGSLSMMHFDVATAILKNLAPLLKKNGQFVVQTHVYREPAFQSIPEVVKHWRESKKDNIFMNTWFEIANIFNDSDFGGFSYVTWKKKLIEEKDCGRLVEKDFELLFEPLRGHEIDIFLHNKTKFENELNSLFVETLPYVANDYVGSDLHPIYHCKGLK